MSEMEISVLQPHRRGADPPSSPAQKQVTGPIQRPHWEGLCFVLWERWTFWAGPVGDHPDCEKCLMAVCIFQVG